jgi:hypothetical protein
MKSEIFRCLETVSRIQLKLVENQEETHWRVHNLVTPAGAPGCEIKSATNQCPFT